MGNNAPLIAEGFRNYSPLYANHGGRYRQANWQREPWGDPRFSQAMRCAIDSEKAFTSGYAGIGFYGGIFGPDDPLVPGYSKWSLPSGEIYAISPCHDPRTSMEDRRLIARGLMEEMGYGPTSPARPETFIWANTSVSDHWPFMVEDLRQVWIEPVWEEISTGPAYTRSYDGDFDISFWSFSSLRTDADRWLYEHYYSTSDRNYGKYTNPTSGCVDRRAEPYLGPH